MTSKQFSCSELYCIKSKTPVSGEIKCASLFFLTVYYDDEIIVKINDSSNYGLQVRVSIPSRGSDFSLRHNVQTGS
jgi:hypothetical protein